MFVRISKGRYKPEPHAEVTAKLDASSRSLVPAITATPGCLSLRVYMYLILSRIVCLLSRLTVCVVSR